MNSFKKRETRAAKYASTIVTGQNLEYKQVIAGTSGYELCDCHRQCLSQVWMIPDWGKHVVQTCVCIVLLLLFIYTQDMSV